MIDKAPRDRAHVVAALRELVEAIDRRVPQVDRVGEVRIAREAAALRNEAVQRIEELSTIERNSRTTEDERSDAVMNDDGGPRPKNGEEL